MIKYVFILASLWVIIQNIIIVALMSQIPEYLKYLSIVNLSLVTILTIVFMLIKVNNYAIKLYWLSWILIFYSLVMGCLVIESIPALGITSIVLVVLFIILAILAYSITFPKNWGIKMTEVKRDEFAKELISLGKPVEIIRDDYVKYFINQNGKCMKMAIFKNKNVQEEFKYMNMASSLGVGPKLYEAKFFGEKALFTLDCFDWTMTEIFFDALSRAIAIDEKLLRALENKLQADCVVAYMNGILLGNVKLDNVLCKAGTTQKDPRDYSILDWTPKESRSRYLNKNCSQINLYSTWKRLSDEYYDRIRPVFATWKAMPSNVSRPDTEFPFEYYCSVFFTRVLREDKHKELFDKLGGKDIYQLQTINNNMVDYPRVFKILTGKTPEEYDTLTENDQQSLSADIKTRTGLNIFL